MRFFVLFSVIFTLSLSAELDSYKDYLVFAAKNHYKTVSDYAKAVGVTDLDSKWEEFKVKFERKYSSDEEERKFNFLKNIQFIESHNNLYEKGGVSHEVAINQFADWSSEEYNSMLSPTPESLTLNENFNITEHIDPSYYDALPPAFDWRQTNKVTPIKNQGQCGSCYAFSAAATIESAYAIKYNTFYTLSAQQLVDCTPNFGCRGGWMDKTLAYAQQIGVESEADYPYLTRQQTCANQNAKYHFRISGYRALPHPARDEDIMAAIMNNGPVAVNIASKGNDFAFYHGGIISTGTTALDHYVTAVGWGPGYWIIKNSWGTAWGEQGYGRVARGMNVRGFNQYLFYPVL